jgi:hypothetical protein
MTLTAENFPPEMKAKLEEILAPADSDKVLPSVYCENMAVQHPDRANGWNSLSAIFRDYEEWQKEERRKAIIDAIYETVVRGAEQHNVDPLTFIKQQIVEAESEHQEDAWQKIYDVFEGVLNAK